MVGGMGRTCGFSYAAEKSGKFHVNLQRILSLFFLRFCPFSQVLFECFCLYMLYAHPFASDWGVCDADESRLNADDETALVLVPLSNQFRSTRPFDPLGALEYNHFVYIPCFPFVQCHIVLFFSSYRFSARAVFQVPFLIIFRIF